MSKTNQTTLDSYDIHVNDYLAATPQNISSHKPEMKEWIDKTLFYTPISGVIFEVGSATLRDASYMRQKGYTVICSDATPGFVKALREKGEDAHFFNVLKDSFPGKYEAIYANGVFPHFTSDEVSRALKNVHDHLKPEGMLSFSIKIGVGEEWITEKFDEKRFTHYWFRQDILETLNKCGFEVIFENSNEGAFPSHHWLNLVSKKI